MRKSKPTVKRSPAPKVQSLEQQNDIYRNLFAQAGMKLPEANQLGNFKIPKLKCPEQIRTSNDQYEWARNVVDYGREPEPKLSYGRPPGWEKSPKPQQPQFPVTISQVPVPPPQESHFGSVIGTAGTDCEYSLAEKIAERVTPEKIAERVPPIPAPKQRWTRSATQRFKEYSFGSEVSRSSSSSGASSVASISSVSSTGAVGSPEPSVVGGPVDVNPNFLVVPPANSATAKKLETASCIPSAATSTTIVSSTCSSDLEIIDWDPKFIFTQLPPSEENCLGEVNLEENPESVEGAGALQLMDTEIPQQPSSDSGSNSSGNGNTGCRGSPLVVKDPPVDLDVIRVSDDESEVLDYDEDDQDVLVIGLSEKEREEVDSWDKLLEMRK